MLGSSIDYPCRLVGLLEERSHIPRAVVARTLGVEVSVTAALSRRVGGLDGEEVVNERAVYCHSWVAAFLRLVVRVKVLEIEFKDDRLLFTKKSTWNLGSFPKMDSRAD